MALDKREIELLASLTTDEAFQLLLTKMEAAIDGLTHTLHTQPDKTAEVLPLWRAMKTIYSELKYTPEEMAVTAESMRHDLEMRPQRKQAQQLADYLDLLQKQQLKDSGITNS